jgi:hydrogenase maturation protein HypF
MSVAVGTRVRVRVRVEGTVQGVGFRPFTYRLARSLALEGWVLNDSRGVLAEVEGPPETVEAFLRRLVSEAPPLAVVERIVRSTVPLDESAREGAAGGGFAIRASPVDAAGTADAPITPDTATCEECLRELFDPADRRYRYPFVNCTNCGPRFTIVQGVPYDRPRTTMAGFQMCPACLAEYEDPGDRRFHAQPNACPVCGPAARLVGGIADAVGVGLGNGTPDAVGDAAAALLAGAIVAIKGIGGYHLACRADDEAVVARLRAGKHREEKPFALMVRDLAAAERLVVLSDPERALLSTPARPILLARRRAEAAVAPSLAPGAPELGVMLPYSPLHHLLLHDTGIPLVLTSGNVVDEPIAFRDEDALRRLGPIAELILTHDRPIQTRTDDSVVRVVRLAGRSQTSFLRRSRGYVPSSMPLPGPGGPPLLACGAELKSTFCLAKGGRAWVSHHIGDLTNERALQAYIDGIRHFESLFDVAPQIVAHDLHPDYLSTRYALDREDGELIAVQHHHAHLAATLAEHGETGPAVGAIFDGAGYGTDGTVWGGELLLGDCTTFERLGHLAAVPLPGGDRAVRQPWRMACMWLDAVLGGGSDPVPPAALADQIDPVHWDQVLRLGRSGLASPTTTSAGRLFDAVAALCGLRPRVSYEGQAAIELEGACDPHERGIYPFEVGRDGGAGLLVLDPREALRLLLGDLSAGLSVGVISARFHAGLASAVAGACALLAEERGLELVVLSGGVFHNRRLLEDTSGRLARVGLRVLTPARLPPGDGAIAYGQAAVAAHTNARVRAAPR